MDAEINNVIYMELNSGPKLANSTCGKTIDVETIAIPLYLEGLGMSRSAAVKQILGNWE